MSEQSETPNQFDLKSCWCFGSGWLPAWWVYNRDQRCTCGVPGGWSDPLSFHELECDAVPCPFCPLEENCA